MNIKINLIFILSASYFLGILFSKVFYFLFNFFYPINFSDLISYTGSVMGAVISIYGIYIQINSDRKKEIEGILTFLNERIDESLNDDELKNTGLFLVYSVISYDAGNIPLDKNYTIFKTFENIPFEIDFGKILHLKLGRKIIELHQKIKLINENFRYLFENFEEKKRIFDKISEKSSIKEDIEIIRDVTTNLRAVATNPNYINRESSLLEKIKDVIDKDKYFFKVIHRNKSEESVEEFRYTEQLLNFHSRENELLNINTFEIYREMECIKKEIDKELMKLKRFI